MMRRLRSFLPALVWAAFVLFLGGQSDIRGPRLDLPIPVDKLAHFTIYGVLGALAAHGWQRAGRWPGRSGLLVALLLIGAVDEIRQRTVAGRSVEFGDWVADALGLLIAFHLVVWLRGKVRGEGENES